MADASLTQMLLSGTAGALIAASLNYYVQTRLAARNKRLEEQRLAYVYFVRISNIITSVDLVKKIYRPYGDLISKELEERKLGEFGVSHAIVATIFQRIRGGVAADKAEIAKAAFFVEYAKEAAAELLDFTISAENLAKLPQEVSATYSTFMSAAFQLRAAIDLLLRFVKEGDLSHLDLDTLYAQWSNAVIFYEAAVQLCAGLRKWGKITAEQERKLSDYHKLIAGKQVLARFNNQEKLKAALSFAQAQAAKQ